MLIDTNTRFRIIADGMKVFGKTIGNRTRCAHWLDSKRYVWFPKLYGKGKTGWENTFSSGERILTEKWVFPGPPRKSPTRFDFDDYTVLRAIFAKDDSKSEYRFRGVYKKLPGSTTNIRQYERMDTTLDTEQWQ